MARPRKNAGWDNLQKGNIPPLKAPNRPLSPNFKNPAGNIPAIEAARRRDKEIQNLARDDPERVQEELYSELSLAALRLTRKLNRQGGEPSRVLVEAWREVRQAGLVVLEIRRTRGALSQAEEFFEELANRIDNINPRLAENAKPITDVPGEKPPAA